MKVHSVEVGDEILVNGCRFILVEMKIEMHKPATVTFKQPIELLPAIKIELSEAIFEGESHDHGDARG